MKKLNMTKIQKQNGSVLILSLMILVVLTMIGVSSMSSSSLQEKMAGNFRDKEIAFQSAEAALAAGEDYVKDWINTANLSNSGGYYLMGSGPTPANAFTGTWWSNTNSIEIASLSGSTVDEVRTQPRYTIEVRGQVGAEDGTSINIGGYGTSSGGGKVTSFRVTAFGKGKSDNTTVILQSNYGKRL